MPPTRPGPPRHDPAWFTCIPPRSLCASGHNDARVDDAAPRADQHLTPSSKPESKPNPAPDGLLPAHRCPPGQLLHAPQTRAKTENPIGQHPRPAASCFGGYRTPAGARFPSQFQTSTPELRLPETGHSFMFWFPLGLAESGPAISGAGSKRPPFEDSVDERRAFSCGLLAIGKARSNSYIISPIDRRAELPDACRHRLTLSGRDAFTVDLPHAIDGYVSADGRVLPSG